jgi:hypothetical protein
MQKQRNHQLQAHSKGEKSSPIKQALSYKNQTKQFPILVFNLLIFFIKLSKKTKG